MFTSIELWGRFLEICPRCSLQLNYEEDSKRNVQDVNFKFNFCTSIGFKRIIFWEKRDIVNSKFEKKKNASTMGAQLAHTKWQIMSCKEKVVGSQLHYS